jgi:2-iminobutanoate/2-iminopropanoate deaminase
VTLAKTKPSRQEMNMAVSYSNPPALAEPLGAHSHLAIAPEGLVAIAGQVAVDRDGNLVGGDDCGGQAEQVFENLRAALAEVVASPHGT